VGALRQPGLVKLFVGVLAGDLLLLPSVRQRLEQELGPVDLASPLFDFGYTRYYEPEMGPDLRRQFWGFERLIAPDRLPAVKLFTNDVETDFAQAGKRHVNLDPGYLTAAKVVLATTKDYSHRLYLGRGIYGEVTLIYRQGRLAPLPWTYPDYRSADYQSFFLALRATYRGQTASP
jgi:hypothetical protein